MIGNSKGETWGHRVTEMVCDAKINFACATLHETEVRENTTGKLELTVNEETQMYTTEYK